MAEQYETLSKFDRKVGSLLHANNLHTKPTTIEHHDALGGAETFIVRTVRDEEGEWVIVKFVDKDGVVRLILPPKVVTAIGRHHDALTARTRSNSSKAQAKERMLRGEVPGFMRGTCSACHGRKGRIKTCLVCKGTGKAKAA